VPYSFAQEGLKTMNRFVGSLVGAFTTPDNQPPRYYADLFAAIVCILSSLVAVAALLSHTYARTLVIAIGVFCVGLLLATRKATPLAAALLFLAPRFTFAFLISFRVTALAGALICWVVVVVLIRQSSQKN
jgi:hypothetical protein